MNINKIGPGSLDAINVIIEVPLHSNIKYEINKEAGIVEVDRMMYSAMSYPANYGFVPKTLSDDGDPADVLVITDAVLVPGCLIKSKLIGVLIMEDESGIDEKLIAVPSAKVDPVMAEVNSLDDLPQHLLKKIKNFFETYKMLEPNKWVKVKEFKDSDTAKAILQTAIDNYKG